MEEGKEEKIWEDMVGEKEEVEAAGISVGGCE